MRNSIWAKNIVSKTIKQYYRTLSLSPHLDIYLFLLSFCIIFFIIYIQFPSLTYNAEVFAESGTNFFIHAYKDTVFTNLFIPDAGYLPLTQRILALVFIKVFAAIVWYPYITQFASIFFIAFAASLINLPAFKMFSSSNAVRFILGIAIGLISDYELHTFINFVYYGALILFLLLFVNKEKLSKFSIYFLGSISALFILSKGLLVVFLPAYILIAFFHFKRKEYLSVIYYFFTIMASLLQLFVMSQNGSKILFNQKLGDFFYYGIKTLYYFLLTYKHVFFGYVTKEKITIVCLIFLFILFAIAIKKLLETEKYSLLAIFLVGNFIAICSLTLTVTVSNSNKNMSQKVDTVQAKIVSFASPRVMQNIQQDNQMAMTIFDDKHHANLRSLFISNLLIFLSGTVILITLVPKKSQKIILVVFLCITSGAFGQVKGEEKYPTKNHSFSQWATYHHLLYNPTYCIPLNPYPFLLEKDCKMILYKNEDFLVYEHKVSEINLSKISPEARNWNIQGVILINTTNQFANIPDYSLYAYDKDGNRIGKAEQFVPSNYRYLYYLFDKQISSTETLIWRNSQGKNISIYPNISLFGTNKNGTKKQIEY